ncbi:hypothetical protein [Clostridium estertheticum]|uniref:Uncharacterized protein n=2 Tax=Clostridium estertheticum TaxID=238834 RepID=A0A1J0GID9_9CLOT|nr:hypothetical protein [Clostridium estertheticum]APC41075.1 hypothetical protein A7L45_13825 [Clostridium estertheticum subsp. estertheticum]
MDNNKKQKAADTDIYKTTVNALALKQSRETFISELPQFINTCTMIAQLQKVYYDELIKAGFTEEHAIRTVIAHGTCPGRQMKESE